MCILDSSHDILYRSAKALNPIDIYQTFSGHPNQLVLSNKTGQRDRHHNVPHEEDIE